MSKPDGVKAIGEPVAHASIGHFDEDGTGKQTLCREHATCSAGQAEGLVGEQVALCEALILVVAAVTPLFAAETDRGQELESRPGYTGIGEQRPEGGKGVRCGGDDLCDGEDGMQTDGSTAGYRSHDAVEGSTSANRVVLFGIDAIERDAKVEAVG